MGLQCKGLTFARSADQGKSTLILDAVDATFEKGCMTLVTGATGAGKSTLLHLLGSLLRPSAGEVWADGQPVSRWRFSHRDCWRRQAGIVFQHLELLTQISVLENIVLPMIPRRMSWTHLTHRARIVLEKLALQGFAQRPVNGLSGGQRQKVAMARAMIAEPRFLLLDEPTSFQDDDGTRMFLALWRQAADQGVCVVVCSHDTRLRDSGGFDRIYGLHRGRLELSA